MVYKMDDKELLVDVDTNSTPNSSFLLKVAVVAIGALFVTNVLVVILFFSNNDTTEQNPCSSSAPHSIEKIKDDANIGVSNKSGWLEAAKFLEKGIDFNAKPCDDFYQFVCGKYQHGSQLTPPFGELQIKLFNDIMAIIGHFTIDKNAPRSLKQTKLVWDKCMNINPSGSSINFSLITPYIEKYGGWPLVFQNESHSNWNPFYLMGVMSSLSIKNIFTASIMPNWKDHDKGNMIFIDQASTLIKKKVYEVKGSEASQWIGEDIKEFAEKMANFYGITLEQVQLQNDIDVMLLIDYRMAMAEGPIWFKHDNFSQVYHEFDLKSANKKWPDVDWAAYLRGLSTGNFDPEQAVNKSFNIISGKFVDILSVLPMSAGKGARHAQNYLMYKFISEGYSLLPGYEKKYRKFEKEKPNNPWEMYQIPEQMNVAQDRTQVCFTLLVKYLRFSFSRLYVEKSFDSMPGKPKDKLRVMTELVLDGFKAMIKGTTWMDEETKFKAYEKIFNVQKNYAYPEWIMDDELLDARHPESHLNVTEDDHTFDMYVKLIKFANWFEWHKFLEPVSRAEFSREASVAPYSINAWYQPWYNSITFPAAFLHKPLFDVGFPMAVNLGALGFVMGHELVHGFDNHGSQFDEIGRLITWISKESYKGYNNMTRCLTNQYNGYCYPKYDNICINGSFTLAENIADNGGIGSTYLAYKNYVEKFGPEPKLPGTLSKYTMEQVFFMAMGMTWCGDATTDPTKQIKTDNHSPGKYRVLGTLCDFPPFAEAFKCKKGSKMAPTKSCKGWWH